VSVQTQSATFHMLGVLITQIAKPAAVGVV